MTPNSANNLEYTPWNDWRAEDYLSEYYCEVMADERFALAFLQESLERLPEVDVALDYGCGPTVHHSVALVEKAKEIHLADYLDDNLNAIRSWIGCRSNAHDWTTFTRYILELQGNEDPSVEAIARAEDMTRQKITNLWQSDAGDTDPLGSQMREFYPLVTTHYCAEGATNDHETWALYMRNICSLVKPGGALIVSACGAADFYTVADKTFPCAGVSGLDVLTSLQQNGFRDIDLRVRSVPDHSDQGYSSVIFACAIKADR
jgi:hypothetical protein